MRFHRLRVRGIRPLGVPPSVAWLWCFLLCMILNRPPVGLLGLLLRVGGGAPAAAVFLLWNLLLMAALALARLHSYRFLRRDPVSVRGVG